MHSKSSVVHYATLRSDRVRMPDNGHNTGYYCTAYGLATRCARWTI